MSADRIKRAGWLPASLRARGALLVVMTALGVALPTAWLFHTLNRRTAARQVASSEALLAVALSEFLAADPQVGARHDDWVVKLANENARLHWAQVFDRNGAGFEFRRRTSLPSAAIRQQIDFDDPGRGLRPLYLGATASDRYFLLTVPGDDGRLLAAVFDLKDRLPAWTQQSLMLAIGLALAAVMGCFVFFRRAILGPVREVVAVAARAHADATLATATGVPPEELAGLVTQAEQTQRELKQWRVEATYLRNAFEAELQNKTRTVESALSKAEQQADTDQLTRLRNRRALQRELPHLFAQAQAEDTELTVVLIDINHFKVFNDTLGHQAGDALLSFVGELIRASTRKATDLAVRFGGDEFVVVLPGTRPDDAAAAFERLAAMFGQKIRTFEKTEPAAGFAAGIASYQRHHPQSPEALLRLADEAMYLAKRTGRTVATVDDLDAARTRQAQGRPAAD
jgi:diguanylate cyclase (GGDEF)-like protein